MVHHQSNKIIISDFLKEQHFLIFIISALLVFFGVNGIIENKSPENLASLSILGNSFIENFEYHVLIFAGAFGVTNSMLKMLKDK